MTGVICAKSDSCGVIVIPDEFQFNGAYHVQCRQDGMHPFLEVREAQKNDGALIGNKIKLASLFQIDCKDQTFVFVNLESHLEVWLLDTWAALQAECLSMPQR